MADKADINLSQASKCTSKLLRHIWNPRSGRDEIPRPQHVFPAIGGPITEDDLDVISPLDQFVLAAKDLCENKSRSISEKLAIATELSKFFYQSVLREASKSSGDSAAWRACEQELEKAYNLFSDKPVHNPKADPIVDSKAQRISHQIKTPKQISISAFLQFPEIRWLDSVLQSLNSCFPDLLPAEVRFRPAPYHCCCEHSLDGQKPCVCLNQRLRFVSATMTEPIPSAGGAEEADAVPLAAEDRKAAAALSRLDQRGSGADDEEGAKQVDNKKLGEAMKAMGGETTTKTPSGPKPAEKQKFKVDKADLDFMMQQFDLSKNKATDYLQKYDGFLAASMAYIHGESRH